MGIISTIGLALGITAVSALILWLILYITERIDRYRKINIKSKESHQFDEDMTLHHCTFTQCGKTSDRSYVVCGKRGNRTVYWYPDFGNPSHKELMALLRSIDDKGEAQKEQEKINIIKEKLSASNYRKSA